MTFVTKFVSKLSENRLKQKIVGVLKRINEEYIVNGGKTLYLKNAIRFRDHRIFFSCHIARVLPRSTELKHPTGIVVNRSTEMGENIQIFQNVTIGGRGGNNSTKSPTIHDDVTIYAGAKVLGDVTLGKGCTIGANSVVLEDVGEGQTAVGVPAREV